MSSEIKAEFGKRFREARDEKKLSRATLGVRLGISPKTIQSWEMGRTFIEDLSLIPAIENELSISVSDLIAKATMGESYAAEAAPAYGCGANAGNPKAGPLATCVTVHAANIGELPDEKALENEFVSVPMIRPQSALKPIPDLEAADISSHVVIPGAWVPRGGVLVAYRMGDSGMNPMIPLGAIIIVDRRPCELEKVVERVVAIDAHGKGMRIRKLVSDPLTKKVWGMTTIEGRRGKFEYREDQGDRVVGRVVGILAQPE